MFSCQECRSECDSCFNKNFCTRCRAGFYLHLGKCQENCSEGLVRSDAQRECIPSEYSEFTLQPSNSNFGKKGYLLQCSHYTHLCLCRVPCRLWVMHEQWDVHAVPDRPLPAQRQVPPCLSGGVRAQRQTHGVHVPRSVWVASPAGHVSVPEHVKRRRNPIKHMK